MLRMVCGDCGADYSPSVRQEWGRTAETVGRGRHPMCVALVPSGEPLTPTGEVPMQTCAGVLSLKGS